MEAGVVAKDTNELFKDMTHLPSSHSRSIGIMTEGPLFLQELGIRTIVFDGDAQVVKPIQTK